MTSSNVLWTSVRNLRNSQMTDEQIDTMLKMYRYLIKCEMNTTIHKINKDTEKEFLQESFNDKEWGEFAKWFKMIKEQ